MLPSQSTGTTKSGPKQGQGSQEESADTHRYEALEKHVYLGPSFLPKERRSPPARQGFSVSLAGGAALQVSVRERQFHDST